MDVVTKVLKRYVGDQPERKWYLDKKQRSTGHSSNLCRTNIMVFSESDSRRRLRETKDTITWVMMQMMQVMRMRQTTRNAAVSFTNRHGIYLDTSSSSSPIEGYPGV